MLLITIPGAGFKLFIHGRTQQNTVARSCVDMVVVDTHVHVGLPTYGPLEELRGRMAENGVEKAVLVQYRRDQPPPGNIDNRYLAECVARAPSKLAAACIVDHRCEPALERLEYWVKEKRMQGIRLAGTDTSPGENKLAIWEKADELGINVSVSGNLNPIVGIAKACPSLNILVEHAGTPRVNGDAILGLAENRNVYVKFTTGGLHAISTAPFPYRDTHAFFQRVYDRFGPERIMWGSDYPPVETREGYAEALAFVREVDWLSEDDREWILGKTALQVWKFADDGGRDH
jgi:predicted TIM-barrel fold metal-dependent hydrolase